MKELDVKVQFKEAVLYVKSVSKYIYASIIIFVFGAIAGFILKNELSFIDEVLRKIISQTIGLGPTEMIFFILQNNLQSAIISIILGSLFGIFPIINSFSNGVIIGYVMSLVYAEAGIWQFWRLLPHGIFELPAIFISFGIGMKLGFSILKKDFRKHLYNSANVALMIVIPLLIIAAFIEGLLIILVK